MHDSPVERITNAALGFLAVWTLLCHAVVFAGGNLHQLLLLAAPIGAATVLLWWRWGRRRERRGLDPCAADPAASDCAEGTPSRFARAASLAAALGCLAVFAATGNLVPFWAGATLLCLALLLRELLRGPSPPRLPAAPKEGGGRALWALCLLCVAVTLTLHRPDADDPFYLHLAVAAVDHPEAPLIAADTLHGIPDVPLPMPVYKVQSLELLQAALAFTTPLRVLDVAHILFPALAAVLLVLAQTRLIRLLAPTRWLVATAMLMAVLLCIGDPHRSYGNFAFVRLFQGKAILLSVMLPLVAATALEFGLAPGWRRLWRLAAAQIAAVGISATALWAAPITAGLALAAVTDLRWRAIRNLLWGLAGSVYVLGLGLLLHGQTADLIQRGEEFWEEYRTAEFALERVLGSGVGVYVFLFALLASWSLATSDLLRRFCAVFALGFLLLFWNPFTDTWVAELLTSDPVYWRVFWLVPLPALLALALTAPLDLFPSRSFRWPASLIPAAVVLLWVPAIATWSPENDVHLGWPQWKLPPVEGEAAAMLVSLTDAGDQVLAPEKVELWIPALHRHPKPLVIRYSFLYQLRGILPEEEILRRIALVGLVSGEQRQLGAETLLGRAIAEYPLAAVCLSGQAMEWPELQRALERSPLELVARRPGYEVWARR